MLWGLHRGRSDHHNTEAACLPKYSECGDNLAIWWFFDCLKTGGLAEGSKELRLRDVRDYFEMGKNAQCLFSPLQNQWLPVLGRFIVAVIRDTSSPVSVDVFERRLMGVQHSSM